MKRGDVILLDYPFADGRGSKVRPAVVVQNDRDNERLTNTIVALVTKNIGRVHEPTQFLIDLSSVESQQSGLKHTSVVTCNNMFTVAKIKIRRGIGFLSPALLTQLDACLKEALQLD